MAQSKLAQRLLFGTLLTVGMAGVLAADGWVEARFGERLAGVGLRCVGFGLLVGVFAGWGCMELSRLAGARGLKPARGIMIPLVVVVATQPVWAWGPLERCDFWGGAGGGGDALGWILAGGVFVAALWQAVRWGTDRALGNLAVTCLAAVYVGLGCWFAVRIRLLSAGAAVVGGQMGPVAMFLACVKSADIGAYLIGRKWGRHKWAPSISPAKTWEGFLGGLAVAAIVGSIMGSLFDIMSVGAAVAFGVVVGTAGQLGDLLESMLKRDAGSKDSAALVPEFGGVLDLIDSVLVAGPFGLIMLMRFGRLP